MKRTILNASFLSAVMLLLLFAAPITAMADGGEAELTQTVDGYRVTLIFKEPITSGENLIHLQIHDHEGQPVSSAKVEVGVVEADAAQTEAKAEHTEAEAHSDQSDMQDMAGMSDMNSVVMPADEHAEMEMVAFAASHEMGEYEGEINIADSGDWSIRVHVTDKENLIKFVFPLQIAGSQAGRNILLVFFAINAVILGTAFTKKLKPAVK